MSETPGYGGGVGGYDEPAGGNAFLGFVQQPRILLIILALWEVVAVLVELFVSRGFSLDINGGLDGILAGRLLSWQAIPLAVLYLYCARDPQRFHGIFWLALIEQVSAVAANLYHFVSDHLEFEAIFVNVIVSAGLGVLVFVHVFQPRESQADRVRV
jgi:hypothetical protein